jgi:hypothetical protein
VSADEERFRYPSLIHVFLLTYRIVLSWATANASPDTVRAVTVASVTGFGNIGSIVGVGDISLFRLEFLLTVPLASAQTWSYINTDAKTGYRIGNALNLSMGSSALILTGLIMLYMIRENKARADGKRDAVLQGKDVHLLGSRHPDFRYIL